MKSVYPKVSVIIPFYKGVNWLDEAVDSVIAQDYPEVEIIIINDGSPEDLTRFLKKYKDAVIMLTQKNKGPAAARNTGINAATGKYVAFLDADDIWMPGKLKCQIEAMEQQNAVWGNIRLRFFGKAQMKNDLLIHHDIKEM
ncbi:hypothetical protein CRH03_16550 [Clostridium sp. HMb25]|nr:hypothetical protein CRH03_16550 [Clostridium sp. HMb25]